MDEDFKLSSGTWVNVEWLRTRLISHCAPLIRDAVIAGHDRDKVTALIIPDLDYYGKPDYSSQCKKVLQSFAAQNDGPSRRVARVAMLTVPLSLDLGEVTDKGSTNQHAVLRNHASLVEDLYAEPPPPHVLTIPTG